MGSGGGGASGALFVCFISFDSHCYFFVLYSDYGISYF
jgi:hypothetical protein